MSELNINWKTIRIGQVANGCIIDYEGNLRIAPLSGLARELALVLGAEDAAGDDDPAEIPQEEAATEKKRRTKTPDVTRELLDAIAAKSDSFTAKDLAGWFPKTFATYKRGNSWLKKAVDEGKIEEGPRGKDGKRYAVVLGAPVMEDDPEEDAPLGAGEEPELGQEEPELGEQPAAIADTDLPF